ncbi:MAG: hypothetical protein ABGF52_12175 [Candidatus Asgardarchaeum sp.]
MDFLKMTKNRAFSKLASNVSDTATSWIVENSSKFPTTYPFHITCEDEIVECTNNDTGTNTLTVIRAQEGTTGAYHAAAKRIELRITAAVITQLQDIINDILSEIHQMQKFTGDGTTTQFNLTYAFKDNSLFVFLTGILQEKDVDYTEAGDKLSITFATAPADGRKIEVRYVKESS